SRIMLPLYCAPGEGVLVIGAGVLEFVADSAENFMRRFWMFMVMIALGAVIGRSQQSAPASPEINQSKAKDIHPPVRVNRPELKVPQSVAAKGINIQCAAYLTVREDGIPQDIRIIRCSDSDFAKYYLDYLTEYRYKPATTLEGKPIVGIVTERVSMQFSGGVNPKNIIRLVFSSPPGMNSSDPDANGVYPLTKAAVFPSMIQFSDNGYGDRAFAFTGNSPCDIVLTINAKGKASDPQVLRCYSPALEKPAVDSLLKSKYKPGSVNGKAVAIRASVHLEYGDIPAKP
ncbi:MAG: energy transducer TonB, partial [Terracidiphilus sp.]